MKLYACSYAEWGGHGYGRARWSSHGQESILESCDIEGILGDENAPAFDTLNADQLAPWRAQEPRDTLRTRPAQPSPLMRPLLEDHDHIEGATPSAAEVAAPPPPGSAAAQVAQAFGRRQSIPAIGASSGVTSSAAHSSVAPASSVEEPDAISRQGSIAPPPGAAAAAVARAFARISTADKEPAQLPTDATQVAYRSAAARLPAPDVGSGGQCTLQREGSVPPTPGLAAAQVASAFARLRSSSSSPRETDTSDSGRKSVDRPRESKAYQHSPSLLSKLGACNGGLACAHSHAAADILMPHVAPAEQDSWGEPAAGDMQAALERSRKDTGGSRDGRSIDADTSEGAAGSAADVKPGKGDGKGPSRHSGKGKERASAKTWTEVGTLQHSHLLYSLHLAVVSCRRKSAPVSCCMVWAPGAWLFC